jgi:hypothetical protein
MFPFPQLLVFSFDYPAGLKLSPPRSRDSFHPGSYKALSKPSNFFFFASGAASASLEIIRVSRFIMIPLLTLSLPRLN